MELLHEKLSKLGWPDGRSVPAPLREEIMEKTSFLPDDTRMSQRLFCIYGKISHPPKCEVCGKDNVRSTKKNLHSDNIYGGWTLTCSKECSYKSPTRRQRFVGSMIENHGVPYSGMSPKLLNKMQDTLEERTGHRFALQSEEGMAKYKDTMTEVYGGFVFSSPSLSKKAGDTMEDRWGVRYSMQSSELLEKAKKTSTKNHGIWPPAKCPKIAYKNAETIWPPAKCPKIAYKNAETSMGEHAIRILSDKDSIMHLAETHGLDTFLMAQELGVHRATINKYLRLFDIAPAKPSSSRGENELSDFISSLGVLVEKQHKIETKKVDIFVPSHNLVVEYNGVYWHSTKFVDKNYHKDRSLMCNKYGKRLIHVWEDEWECPIRREVIKTKLRIVLGVYDGDKIPARKTEVRYTDFKEVSPLLTKHHIQGTSTGTKYVGCYYDGNLVGCLVMKRHKKDVWELARFATNCLLLGGLSKMLAFFKKNEDWSEIFSFADYGISDGNVYEKTGFALDHHTAPIMSYTKDGDRYRRERFMKHKLPKLFDNVDMSLTEREIMEVNGYHQIFDAGLLRYSMKNV